METSSFCLFCNVDEGLTQTSSADPPVPQTGGYWPTELHGLRKNSVLPLWWPSFPGIAAMRVWLHATISVHSATWHWEAGIRWLHYRGWLYPLSYTQTHVLTHITAKLISRILLIKCASADSADGSAPVERTNFFWSDEIYSYGSLNLDSHSPAAVSHVLERCPLPEHKNTSDENFVYLTEELYLMCDCEPAGLQWSAAHFTLWTQTPEEWFCFACGTRRVLFIKRRLIHNGGCYNAFTPVFYYRHL